MPTSKLCPPYKMVELVTHWITDDTNFLSSQPLPQDDRLYLRSEPSTAARCLLLPGLIQWCVLEPLVPDDSLPSTANYEVSEYRSQMSLLHTELLLSMVTLGHTSSLSTSVLPTDELAIIVANLLDYSQSIEWAGDAGRMETSLNRLAQMLQIGLNSNVMSLTSGNGYVPASSFIHPLVFR